jgi:hypothetical protein
MLIPTRAELVGSENEIVSYTNSTAPSITVIFKTQRRMMWPIYLLGLVEYRPKNFDDEGTTDRRWECLRMALGEELAIVYGFNLVPIHKGLAEGQGCVLTEAGERYVALGKKGEAIIARIEVKALREEEEPKEVDHVKDREPQGLRA